MWCVDSIERNVLKCQGKHTYGPKKKYYVDSTQAKRVINANSWPLDYITAYFIDAG